MLGDSTTGRGFRTQIEIPNSEYLDLITGTSETYKPQPSMTPVLSEQYELSEPAGGILCPANKGTVLALSRLIHFADGPLTEVVIKGLMPNTDNPGFAIRMETRAWNFVLFGHGPGRKHAAAACRHFCALQTTAGTGGWLR